MYDPIILTHAKNPLNFGHLHNPTHTAFEENPVCGDKISLQLIIADDIIQESKFTGQGCYICLASASIMTSGIIKLSTQEVIDLTQQFKEMLTADDDKRMGALSVFTSIKKYPVRIKCAMMPWDALRSCLETV